MSDKKIQLVGDPGDNHDGPPLPRVFDARGRQLQLGDEVLVVGMPCGGIVKQIKPILHPQAPRGACKITILQVIELTVLEGQPLQEAFRVATTQEIKEAREAAGMAAPPAGSPA